VAAEEDSLTDSLKEIEVFATGLHMERPGDVPVKRPAGN
jgi:hypothetical protein